MFASADRGARRHRWRKNRRGRNAPPWPYRPSPARFSKRACTSATRRAAGIPRCAATSSASAAASTSSTSPRPSSCSRRLTTSRGTSPTATRRCLPWHSVSIQTGPSPAGTIVILPRGGFVLRCGIGFWLYAPARPIARRGLGSRCRSFSTLSSNEPIILAPSMIEVSVLAHSFAESQTAILLYGETGVGKTFIARHIHALSGRPDGFHEFSLGTVSSTLSSAPALAPPRAQSGPPTLLQPRRSGGQWRPHPATRCSGLRASWPGWSRTGAAST